MPFKHERYTLHVPVKFVNCTNLNSNNRYKHCNFRQLRSYNGQTSTANVVAAVAAVVDAVVVAAAAVVVVVVVVVVFVVVIVVVVVVVVAVTPRRLHD